MKYEVSSLLILSLFALAPLQADTFIGSDIEVGLWSPSYDAGNVVGDASGEDQSIFASATLEHGIPAIPNLKVSLSQVDNDKYEYTKIDYTAYYEALDNDLVSIDVGMGLSQYKSGEYLSQEFGGTIPHVYVDAELGLPLMNTTLYTDVKFMDYDGSQITDAMAGLRYDVNLIATDLGIKGGYRMQSVDTQDIDDLSFDVKTDGYFLGLHADF